MKQKTYWDSCPDTERIYPAPLTPIGKKEPSVFRPADIRRFFDDLLAELGLTKHEAIDRANIDRAYGYQILNGTRIVNRDCYIQLAFAMGLDIGATQRMLTVTERGPLSTRCKRDAAILFAMKNGYDPAKLNDFLLGMGLSPLGESASDTEGL